MFVGEPQGRSRKKWTTAIAAIMLAGGIAIGMRLTSGSKSVPSPPAPPAPKIEQVSAPSSPADPVVVTPPADTRDESPRPKTPARPPATKTPVDRPPVKHVGNATPVPPAPDVSIDAGIIEMPDPPQKLKPLAVDRNQTINPFKRKVNP
jgi:hypothetical protein